MLLAAAETTLQFPGWVAVLIQLMLLLGGAGGVAAFIDARRKAKTEPTQVVAQGAAQVVEAMQTVIDPLKEKVEQLTKENRSLSAKVAALMDQNQTFNRRVAQLTQQNAALTAEVSRLTETLRTAGLRP